MKRALVVMILLAAPVQAQLDVFPSHAEVESRLMALAHTPGFEVRSVGASIEGRDLWLAVVTDPASTVPMEDRVVTLLLTQQHGNEPAGTPAALALLEDIAAGDMEWLHNQVLLVQPMGNPDGATADQRANAASTDLNRDHIHLEQPETQALHALLQEWDVHVGVDHHEYSGAGVGYPSPARTYDYDLTTLFPRHGNVRAPTQEAAEALMYDGMWPAAESAGYSINEYGEQTVAGQPVDHIAGGPDPGILRNNFGLNNIAGILVESFVPTAPNPLIDAERREAVHRVLMEATLQYASENAADLIAAKRESERLNVESPRAEYVEAWPADPVPLPGDTVGSDIRAPLATAYATSTSADDVMTRHGLPVGEVGADGWVYSLLEPRGGLIAAIVHPDSSRNVVAGTPVALPEDEAADTPLAALVGLAAVAVALVLRRRME